jgi:hypothetical protein
MFSSHASQHAQNLTTKKFYAVLMPRISLLPQTNNCFLLCPQIGTHFPTKMLCLNICPPQTGPIQG